MGIFDSIFTSSNSISPYKDKSANLIYNLLFCDNLSLYKNNSEPVAEYPWNILFSDKVDENELNEIINNNNSESRVKLLSYNLLKNMKKNTTKGLLLGVIIEVSLEKGLDTVAVYKDFSARYINYSGKMVVWETQNSNFTSMVKDLFKYSDIVVKKIGPWDKDRLPQPKKGNVRLTFLTSDGIYFGEGLINTIANDSMGGPVFSKSAEIMKYLVDTAINK